MKHILEAARRSSDAAEVFDLDSLSTIVGFDTNRLKFIDTSQERGCMLRLIVDGKLGQGYATNLAAADTLVAQVRQLAELGDPAGFDFAEPAPAPTLSLVHPLVTSQTIDDMIASGRRAIDIVQSYDPNINTGFAIATNVINVAIANTRGADHAYRKAVASCGLVAELIQPTNIIQLIKSYKGMTPHPDPTELAREIVTEMEIAKTSVSFPTGKFPIILTPPALGDIFMAFVDSVNGDLVAKGTSPLTGKMGQPILDERITIVDDPLHPDGTLSAPVDDEGTPSRRKLVIDKGVLRSWLTNRRAAAALGVEPSGNGLRVTAFERAKSYTAGVNSDFTNLILAPGAVSYEAMIGGIGRGLEIHYITGILLGNLINGDFSGNLEVAYRIENGRRVGRVKDVMISGNFFKLFKDNLLALGDRGYWTGSFGGSAGSMLLPFVALQDVEISGRE